MCMKKLLLLSFVEAAGLVQAAMPPEDYGHCQDDLQFSLPSTRTRNTAPLVRKPPISWDCLN